MSGITAHVLDTAIGKPAPALDITLERLSRAASGAETFEVVAHAVTDEDGRVADLTEHVGLAVGTYRITFATGAYFASRGVSAFYPRVEVLFAVLEPSQHYHIPLLLSPFGYSTYRGS